MEKRLSSVEASLNYLQAQMNGPMMQWPYNCYTTTYPQFDVGIMPSQASLPPEASLPPPASLP